MLNAVTYHGSSRHDRIRELLKVDVVLTTYGTLRRDFARNKKTDTLYTQKWRRIVLDEGLPPIITTTGFPYAENNGSPPNTVPFLAVSPIHPCNIGDLANPMVPDGNPRPELP